MTAKAVKIYNPVTAQWEPAGKDDAAIVAEHLAQVAPAPDHTPAEAPAEESTGDEDQD